ncbi:hypothetical protein [Luteimonas sp. FCS-9]|uniref:hypothetical protein n=1 Tax=Luteimonas sp. FCS-9 TaxID=1547516 RepID=UPI000AC0F180|nr:hypothetical protein [Luteimonas sp. FCS-9]
MELLVALAALAITLWQLKLQRDEIRANSQINSLIHVARLLSEKIEHHERIIGSLKSKKADWTGHAHRVNRELRPMLAQVNAKLLDSIEAKLPALDPATLRQALKLNDDQNAA